jgi:hypothetical protein
MRLLTTKNTGATDYWHFPWFRYPGECKLEWKAPIFMASLLRENPGLKMPFIRRPEMQPEIYYPLEINPGISREFSELKDLDGACAFANKFGVLGLESVPRYAGCLEELHTNGENVNDWRSEATQLKQVYEVWDLAACDGASDRKSVIEAVRGLREIVTLNEQGCPILLPKAGHLKEPRGSRSSVGSLKQNVLFGLAKQFIAERFNHRMVQMASPALLLDAKGNLRPYNVPASLLAALWLEFGQLASGVKKQKLCESCGRWMDVTGCRSDKRKHRNCIHRETMARYRAGRAPSPIRAA